MCSKTMDSLFFAMTYDPSMTELLTYAETDLCFHRRHWMTSEQMKEYEATPVMYPDRDTLVEAMSQMWAIEPDHLVICEILVTTKPILKT